LPALAGHSVAEATVTRSDNTHPEPFKGRFSNVSPASTDSPVHSHDRRTRIFVYGSLKRGYALHHLLKSQLSVGHAVTSPLYRIFDLGSYPGLIEWPDGLAVEGELYLVDAECLQTLDEAEAVEEGHYARRRILLDSTSNEEAAQAWFWLNSVSGLRDCGYSWP